MSDGGQTLGVQVASRYRLDRLVGKGNLGNVYAAWDEKEKREVTLKLAHALGGNSRSMAARFRRELELGQKLRHPAISKPLDAGEFLGSPFLVCEYVEGQSIVDWFEASGRNFEALASTLEVLLEALQLAHGQKSPHRALKPEHILVSSEGSPKILDFGLSTRLDDQLASGQRNPLALAYLSPEQIIGERGDGRSDLYALGCILYQVAAGVPPFAAPTVAQMLLCHLHQVPVPLSNLPRSVPNWLDRLVRRLLLKQPLDRPPTAADVLQLVRRRPSRGPQVASRLGPLLGREGELEALAQALTAAGQGQGECLWLWGEPGIGKAHLLQHLRRLASAQSVEWVELEGGDVRPLHWLDWVQHPQVRCYPEGARLAQWASQRSRCCILRGFEQSDDSLWGMLSDWSEQIRSQPLLLIFVSDEPPRETFVPRLTRLMHLQGISRDDCARYIEERIWAPPPPEATAWFHRISGGNPLFLGWLLEKLEGQYLSLDGPAARWTAPPSHFEGNLAAWIQREIAEMGPQLGDLLQVASVIGERFPYNLVKSLYLGEEAQLEQSLDQLVRAGWLQENWDAGVASHRFTHRARWLACQQGLDRRRARRLSTLVGAFLEFPQSGKADWARAADYYGLSQDNKALLRCLTQCLVQACEHEDWELARAWMRRCQKPASQVVDRIFPGPWYHFGWTGLNPATGPRHFLATLLAYQGRGEDAMWQLQISLEDNLEDDPPRYVENLLLRVVFQLRGWVEGEQPIDQWLSQARDLSQDVGFHEGEALASALAMRLVPHLKARQGTSSASAPLEGQRR